MIKLPEYSKPVAEYKPEAQLILGKHCYAQEKFDGSQFSFAHLEGKFYARSRNLAIFEDQVPDLFSKAYFGAKDLIESGRLDKNIIYRAEAFKGPKHNSLKYDRAPEHGFIAFDAQDALTGKYLPMEAFMAWSCEYALVHDCGPFENRAELLLWAKERSNRNSQLGGAIEGFVFKELTDRPDRAVVKVVRDEFKELHAGNPDWQRTGPKNGLDKVLAKLCGPARYTKALNHLREAGLCTVSMRDMPGLMKELHMDLDSDCADIKDILWEVFGKEIKRQIGGGLTLWYKDYLRDITPSSEENTDDG